MGDGRPGPSNVQLTVNYNCYESSVCVRGNGSICVCVNERVERAVACVSLVK